MRKAVPAWFWVVVLGAGAVSAQEEPASYTPLKLELTLSKPREESAAATSYALYLLADGGSTELRSGREVPVPVASALPPDAPPEERARAPRASFPYRNVGFNLMARAWRHRDRFRILLNLERSSLLETSGLQPSFQTFNVQHEVLLGDGESARLVEGSDPSLGDAWSIDVKLEVVK